MNYFNLFKFSALKKDWYLDYIDHFNNTIPFVFQDDIELIDDIFYGDTLETFPNEHGENFQNIIFRCKRTLKPRDYKVYIYLRFRSWQYAKHNLQYTNEADTQENLVYYGKKIPTEFYQANVTLQRFVLASDNETYFARPFIRKRFSTEEATPYNIVSFIKNAITTDRFDDDFNSDDEQPDQPSPYLDSPKQLQRA